VLFTADLKAFSERLVTKIEIKEERAVIKMEDGDAVAEHIVKKEPVKRKMIKQESEDDDQAVVQVKEETTRRSKRRKA
jgi:N-glycosylase/DNA lyase